MPEPTNAHYRKAVTEMLAHFGRIPALQAKASNVRLLQIAYAWSAQIHRFARAILTLVDAGFEHEATVLVRSMLEYTITLHWLVEAGDQAVDAAMRQHQRALRNVQQSASKRDGMLLPDGAINEVLALDIPKVDEESTLRHFEQICAQLGIDHNLYVVYRVQSSLVHPTFSSVREYVSVDETGMPRALLQTPTPKAGAVAWTAYCLVWSGRALDQLLAGRPLRKDLQKIAREVGTAFALPHRSAEPKKASSSKSGKPTPA